jgi:hypothetical protein
MARTKGRSTRGKSRVSQAPMGRIEQELRDTYAVLVQMDSTATDHCPLCAAMGVEQGRYGAARGTVRAAVEPAPPGTV